jgi:hypothetical protein
MYLFYETPSGRLTLIFILIGQIVSVLNKRVNMGSKSNVMVLADSLHYDNMRNISTNDGFEGLQGLWTGGDGGWDFRPDRFFFGKNQGKKLKKKSHFYILDLIMKSLYRHRYARRHNNYWPREGGRFF